MKTKNQTEQDLFELAVTKAANDDGVPAGGAREEIIGCRASRRGVRSKSGALA